MSTPLQFPPHTFTQCSLAGICLLAFGSSYGYFLVPTGRVPAFVAGDRDCWSPTMRMPLWML